LIKITLRYQILKGATYVKKYRILALILAVLMVAALFAGCGKKEDPEETTDTTTTSESTTTTTPEETTESTTEKIDLQGYNFMWINGGRNYVYFAEPSNADQQGIMDLIWAIEDEYNCVFSDTNFGYSNNGLTTPFFTAAMAGDKFADVIFGEQSCWGAAILQGYARRLDTDEVRATGMDVLDSTQFNSYVTNAAKIDEQVYVTYINGEFFGQQIGHVFCFNKALCATAGYSSDMIYQSVRDFTWTWDVLIDISLAGCVYNDETGWYDVMGCGHVFAQSAFPAMCNDPIIYQDGKYINGMNTVSFIAAYNTLHTRVFADPRVHYTDPTGGKLGNAARRQAFYDGKAMFGTFFEMNLTYDNCSFDYGIVPYPHGASSSQYAVNMLYLRAAFVQTANQDWETTCFLFSEVGKALNDEQAGIDKLCFYVRDAESVEMFTDYILPNMTSTLMSFNQSVQDEWTAIQTDIDTGVGSVMQVLEAHKATFETLVAGAFATFNNN